MVHCSGTAHTFNRQHDIFTTHSHLLRQHTTLPTVGVAYKALPHALLCFKEYLLIVTRLLRLKTEDLNCSTGLLAETQTCLNHLGIVEHHKCPLRYILWKIGERVLTYNTFIIKQEF